MRGAIAQYLQIRHSNKKYHSDSLRVTQISTVHVKVVTDLTGKCNGIAAVIYECAY